MPSPPTPDPRRAGWRMENTYAGLPAALHSRVHPTPVARPRAVLLNAPLARSLGLDPEALQGDDAAGLLAGNVLPEGADPIAQAYAGHQFGNLTRLGDGRAILLGEQRTPDGVLRDIQLKGAGPTPYSRRGDGRAALGPMLREYLVSEALHAHGIPTTRSLAVVGTGEPVFREEPLPGAVLTRVADSHIRFGTFELFAALGDTESLRALADYTLRRHFPDLVDAPQPVLGLLERVVGRSAGLVAQWMRVGFVHGVLNTDNMTLSGETIDYGPCAFIDAYDPKAVFSSIDHQGRYAFGNQPGIVGWNLARLAEALLPLLNPDPGIAAGMAQSVLESYPGCFERAWQAMMRGKLGLLEEDAGDVDLAQDLLAWMHRSGADYTRTFRGLESLAEGVMPAEGDPEFQAWHRRWTDRLARQAANPVEVRALLRRNNPAVIPRNHRVESALLAATRGQDLAPFQRLLEALARPCDEAPSGSDLALPPPPGTPRCRTFCGT